MLEASIEYSRQAASFPEKHNSVETSIQSGRRSGTNTRVAASGQQGQYTVMNTFPFAKHSLLTCCFKSLSIQEPWSQSLFEWSWSSTNIFFFHFRFLHLLIYYSEFRVILSQVGQPSQFRNNFQFFIFLRAVHICSNVKRMFMLRECNRSFRMYRKECCKSHVALMSRSQYSDEAAEQVAKLPI